MATIRRGKGEHQLAKASERRSKKGQTRALHWSQCRHDRWYRSQYLQAHCLLDLACRLMRHQKRSTRF